MFEQIRFLVADFQRWPKQNWKQWLSVFCELGFWATVFFRISRALYLCPIPLLRVITRIIAFFMTKFSEIFFHAMLRPSCNIGPGFYLVHTGAVGIHPNVKVGKNLCMMQQASLAQRGKDYEKDIPTVGDDVFIGLGAKVMGPISVGNRVSVGAGAIVIHDVPDDATVVGVPARIVRIKNEKV